MAQGANGEYHCTVMGRGVVDYPAILRAAKGLKRYYIEQEEFDIPWQESLKVDADYLKSLTI